MIVTRPPANNTQNARQEHGDLTIVRTMLDGGDLANACLTLLQARLDDDTLRLDLNRPDTGTAVEVTQAGHAFGWLTSHTSDALALVPAAQWLSAWLLLGKRHRQAHLDADIDPLTGAFNRRYFDRYLAAAIDTARAQNHSVTILYFDIDDLKHFNDDYGHDAGDDILRETVRLLQSVIRPSDRVCRVGGDEFVVIFHEPAGPRDPGSKPPEHIHEIAHRFQQQIQAHKFPKLGEGAPGRLTISGGLATFPGDGHDSKSLLRIADQLTLESKRRGKNVIIIGDGAALNAGKSITP